MTFLNCLSKTTNQTGSPKFSSPRACGPSPSSIKKALLSFAVLGLSFATVGVAQTSASPIVNQVVSREGSETVSQKSDYAKDLAVLEDGIYLFGQSPQRDQIGVSYTIFSVSDNQTVGAFYQPNSSFDCFSGQIHPDRMALNIVDSYEQTVHPYAIALTTDTSLTAGSAAPAYTLTGFHHIENVSDQDLDILSVCEADFNR